MKRCLVPTAALLLAGMIAACGLTEGLRKPPGPAQIRGSDVICRSLDSKCSDCEDGVTHTCYFDSSMHRKADLKTGHFLPPRTRAACFAIHSRSVCRNCYATFEVRQNGVLERVSCIDFFRRLEEKNRACHKCLDQMAAGCC